MSLLLSKIFFFLKRFIGLWALGIIPSYLLNHQILSSQLSLSLVLVLVLFFLILSYLLSQKVDSLLKLHVKTHSSLDRILYRVLTGQSLLIVFSFLFSMFLSDKVISQVAIVSYTIILMLHAWPTRKKMYIDSLSQDLSEYRYLDGFERMALMLTLATVLLSIPSIPEFQSVELLKLYIDPREFVHHSFWTYLSFLSNSLGLNQKNSVLFQLFFWHISFTTLALLSVYSLLRYFTSRRIALLVVYAMVSSWSYSKGLQFKFLDMLFSCLGLIWMWAFFWTLRSSNYRAGFILGLATFYTTLFHWTFFYLWIAQVTCLWLMKDRFNLWYRKQFIRYSLLGGILSALVLFSHQELHYSWKPLVEVPLFAEQLWQLFWGKSIFQAAPLGLLALILAPYYEDGKIFFALLKDQFKWHDLMMGMLIFLPFGLLILPASISGLFSLCVLSVFSLLPLERLFQILHRERSQRNMLYLTYILFCILDSHLEGRVKLMMQQLEQFL